MKTKRPFLSFKDIPILYHPLFLIAFCLLIVGIYFISSPRYSPGIFPFKRTKMLTSFIESAKKQGKINPQEFWALREFYAPGTLSINKEATNSPFLIFTSDKITSKEWLLPKTVVKARLPKDLPTMQNKFKTYTEFIYYEGQFVHIIFIKPVSEMVTANAVYDYKDKDRKFLEGKLWFVETVINTK